MEVSLLKSAIPLESRDKWFKWKGISGILGSCSGTRQHFGVKSAPGVLGRDV